MNDPFNIARVGAPTPAVDTASRLGSPLAPTPTTSFNSVLADAVGEVQRLQTEADTTIRQLVAGEIKDVSQAMVAVEKADVSFQTMLAVRNKMVAAYEEVMRMQV